MQVMDMLTAITQALGIPPMGADLGGPQGIDGADPMGAGGPPPGGPPVGPGGPPPPGVGGPPGGPPHGHPGAGGPPVHAPHPGEAPSGPPLFSSVDPNHPWAHTVGKVAHFRVAENLGDQKLEDAEVELQAVARAGGFKVSQVRPLYGEDGQRVISAVISTPKQR
jgi:hypothetical protein